MLKIIPGVEGDKIIFEFFKIKRESIEISRENFDKIKSIYNYDDILILLIDLNERIANAVNDIE
jgi:hypothetical protein